MDNIQPGQMLGPYRILHQIGQGGMATVYKAYHATMDRYVAVKVLPRQLAENPEFSGRFEQEARIIANLEHARILPVHDYGESNGIAYLVMRYLDAGTLKDRMKTGPLPLNEIDRLFSQLADALDYAHSRGVIHRDLKPSNALMDARGDLFLSDFGIAKLLESSAQFTGTGAMVGTPAYMSPEQAQGQKVDQRTDIYALGIILYEMVTGRVPYEAETPLAVILKHLNEPLPLPTTLKPDLAPSIERVLLKALAKNPEDRFATIAEFVGAWRAALTEVDTLRVQPVVAPAVGPIAPAAETASMASIAPPAPVSAAAAKPKLSPLAWILGGVGGGCLLLIVLAFAAFPRLLARLSPDRPQATAAPTEVVAATDVPPGATPILETPSVELTAPAIVEPFPTSPPIEGVAGWTQWTPANVIFGATVAGDQVFTWGRGGVLVWDRADGSLIQRFTTLDGLPSSQVNALLVDEEEEALWAGTEDGLGLYDEGKWTIYNEDDGLDSDTIGALTWAGDNLVVGTYYSGLQGGGLYSFDGSQWSPVPDFPSANSGERPDLLDYNVNDLLFDENNSVLWVATENGVGRYDGQSWSTYFVEQGLPDNGIWALTLDDNGDLWAGTEGGAARFNGETFEAVERLQDEVRSINGIVVDGEGRYWFSGNTGLARFDPQVADWEFFTGGNADLPYTNFLRAARDEDGNLYFGSYGGGLIRYDGGDFSAWTVPNLFRMYGVGRILPAPDGTLLFKEEYGSLTDRYDPAADVWSPFELPCDSCSPQTYDPAGNLWLGGDLGAWVVPADGSARIHLTTEQGLPSDYVQAIAFDSSGFAWIGTDAGVAVYDGANVLDVLTAESVGLATNNVRVILKDSYGAMWVGTEGGLSHFTSEASWEHFAAGNPFGEDSAFVSDLVDVQGVLWVATLNDGFYRYANGEWARWDSHSLNAVAAAPDGTLWFGTYNNGAGRFDGNKWEGISEADGLPNYNVTDVYVDPSGVVWFATSNGVARYVP